MKIASPRGCNFTDRDSGNSIFFPVCGYRAYNDGKLYADGSCGRYWANSSRTYGRMERVFGATLDIYDAIKAGRGMMNAGNCVSVRCVAK